LNGYKSPNLGPPCAVPNVNRTMDLKLYLLDLLLQLQLSTKRFSTGEHTFITHRSLLFLRVRRHQTRPCLSSSAFSWVKLSSDISHRRLLRVLQCRMMCQGTLMFQSTCKCSAFGIAKSHACQSTGDVTKCWCSTAPALGERASDLK
jgi:hypothetical protein